jgi:hypothetical protein
MVTEFVTCEAMAKSGYESVREFKLPAAIATGVPPPPCVAVIEVVPAATPVATPELAPIVATELFEEAQTTVELTS